MSQGTEWEGISRKVRDQLAIGSANKWAARPGTRGVPLAARQHDVINVAYGHKSMQVRSRCPGATVEEITRDFYVDVNPGVQYRSWGWIKGMTTGSTFYSFELKRELQPLEHFSLLGYDAAKLDIRDRSSSEPRDLSGNAHSFLQPSVVLLTLLLCVDLPDIFD